MPRPSGGSGARPAPLVGLAGHAPPGRGCACPGRSGVAAGEILRFRPPASAQNDITHGSLPGGVRMIARVRAPWAAASRRGATAPVWRSRPDGQGRGPREPRTGLQEHMGGRAIVQPFTLSARSLPCRVLHRRQRYCLSLGHPGALFLAATRKDYLASFPRPPGGFSETAGVLIRNVVFPSATRVLSEQSTGGQTSAVLPSAPGALGCVALELTGAVVFREPR